MDRFGGLAVDVTLVSGDGPRARFSYSTAGGAGFLIASVSHPSPTHAEVMAGVLSPWAYRTFANAPAFRCWLAEFAVKDAKGFPSTPHVATTRGQNVRMGR